jgi:hypothetical protein
MKNMTSAMTVCVVMVGLFLISGPSPAQEDSDTVSQVVRIDTHGNTAAYLAAVKAVLDRIEALAPESNSRVWEATFSGDTTGTVYVVIEYPSMASFAAATEKSFADEAFTKGVAALAATGRTVESNSVLREITP